MYFNMQPQRALKIKDFPGEKLAFLERIVVKTASDTKLSSLLVHVDGHKS